MSTLSEFKQQVLQLLHPDKWVSGRELWGKKTTANLGSNTENKFRQALRELVAEGLVLQREGYVPREGEPFGSTKKTQMQRAAQWKLNTAAARRAA